MDAFLEIDVELSGLANPGLSLTGTAAGEIMAGEISLAEHPGADISDMPGAPERGSGIMTDVPGIESFLSAPDNTPTHTSEREANADWLAGFLNHTIDPLSADLNHHIDKKAFADPPDNIIVTGTRSTQSNGLDPFFTLDLLNAIAQAGLGQLAETMHNLSDIIEQLANVGSNLLDFISVEHLAAIFHINIAPGVLIEGLSPNMLSIFDDIAEAWSITNVDPTITSGTDGIHGPNSLHPGGNAIDLRTYNLTSGQISAVAARLANRLGADYDVVIESDHIHVEYDPGS